MGSYLFKQRETFVCDEKAINYTIFSISEFYVNENRDKLTEVTCKIICEKLPELRQNINHVQNLKFFREVIEYFVDTDPSPEKLRHIATLCAYAVLIHKTYGLKIEDLSRIIAIKLGLPKVFEC